MKNLILDCSAGMSLYVENDGKIFSFIDTDEKKHSDELLKKVDELLNQAGLKISEIENICVCVGPGSFTGVRVAISIAKGLAIGASANVVTLENFDTFDTCECEKYISVLDGFSNFVYVRIFDGKEKKEKCIDIKELAELIKEKYSDFEILTIYEKTQNMLKKYEIYSKNVDISIISAFNDKILRKEFAVLNQIMPVYLRASQAEIERNKKLNLNGGKV